MSFVKKTKEFFGLAPEDGYAEDYYDAPEYHGAVAYAPRYEEQERYNYEAPRYSSRVVDVRVERYADATRIGQPFRDGDAVVFDISAMQHTEAKRIIDFAAGLCFALRGQMTKLDSSIFAVVPKEAQVTTQELERAAGLL